MSDNLLNPKVVEDLSAAIYEAPSGEPDLELVAEKWKGDHWRGAVAETPQRDHEPECVDGPVKDCLNFIRQCVQGRCNALDLDVIREAIDRVRPAAPQPSGAVAEAPQPSDERAAQWIEDGIYVLALEDLLIQLEPHAPAHESVKLGCMGPRICSKPCLRCQVEQVARKIRAARASLERKP